MSNWLENILVILLVACLCTIMQGQQSYEMYTRHISTQQGLSNRKVNHINQDKEGFIWISTENGLNRFDGSQFKVYNRKNGLRYKSVSKSFEDKNGNIWIITMENPSLSRGWLDTKVKSIDIFNPFLESVIPVEEYCKGISGNQWKDITQDEDNNLWLWTEKGKVYCFTDHLSSKFIFLTNESIHHLAVASKDYIYLGSEHKLYKLTFDGVLLETDSFSTRLLGTYIDEFGTVWVQTDVKNRAQAIGTQSILFVKTKDSDKFQSYSPFPDLSNQFANYIKPIFGGQYEKGFRWGFVSGYMSLHIGPSYTVYDINKVFNLKGLNVGVLDVFVDKQKNFWISTHHGVLLLKVYKQKFRRFLDSGKISTRGIIPLDTNKLLVYTSNKPYLLNTITKKEERFHPRYEWATKPSDYLIDKAYFWGIKDRKGDYWAGKHGAQIHHFSKDLSSWNIYRFKPGEKGQPKPKFRNCILVYEDPGINRIWIGSRDGLAYYDAESSFIKPLDNVVGIKQLDQQINHLFRDSSGLWIAADNGLFLYNEIKEQVRQVSNIPPTSITYIYKDSEQIFWIGTENKGLIRWDRTLDKVDFFTKSSHGLSDNNIVAIYEDKYNQLWVPSFNGLMRIDKNALTIQSFYQENGTASQEFNYSSHYQQSNGKLYFGGLNGITEVDPDLFVNLNDKKREPELVFTQVDIFNASEKQWFNYTSEVQKFGQIVLKPGDPFFTIEYALLDYFNCDRHQYAYRILGLDEEWQMVEENKIRLSRLPYGTYTIEIKGKEESGDWLTNHLKLKTIVIKPFYLQTWFLFTMGFGFASLLGLGIWANSIRVKRLNRKLESIINERTKTIASQKEELEKLNITKDRLFQIIAHDLRSPVNAFRMLGEKVRYLIETQQYARLEELGFVVERASINMHQLLDNLLNWSISEHCELPYEPEWVNIAAEMKNNIGYFESAAALKKVQIDCHINKAVLLYIDRNTLNVVIRNVLSNAIKFSPDGGKVTILSELEKEGICISIQDEGPGFDVGQDGTVQSYSQQQNYKFGKSQSTGLGLKLIRYFMNRSEGTWGVESKPEVGTRINLRWFQVKQLKDKHLTEKQDVM